MTQPKKAPAKSKRTNTPRATPPPVPGIIPGEESAERFRNILRDVPSVAVQGYTLDGVTTYWNAASETLYGYTTAEALGRNLLELIIPPEMRDGVSAAIREMAGTKQPIPAAELLLMRKDGSRVPVFSSHALVQTPDGTTELFCLDIDLTARKRAEAALKESEERYQRITEAVTDYIYHVRVAEGRAVETTHGPGCLAVTGYGSEEFAHDTFLWLRMVVEADRPLIEVQAHRILAGEDPPPLEHRITHKSGAVRWVRNTFVPHRNEQGVLIAYDGLIQNITAQKLAEDALRRSKQQYDNLAAQIPIGIYILHSRADGSFALDYASPRMADIFQTSVASLLADARIVLRSIHPEEAAAFAELNAEGIRHLRPFNWEGRALINGAVKWLQIVSSPEPQEAGDVLWFGIVNDITARKQAAEALRDNEASLRESQMIAGLGTYLLDIPGGVWQSSDVLDLLFGIAKAPGHSVEEWETLIHPDDRTMMADYLRHHVVGQRQAFNKEYRIIRRDTREERWVHGIGRLEFDSSGQPLRMRGTIQDITKRKLAEKAIAALALRNQTLLQTASDGIHVVDDQGKVVEANTAFCRMLGYTREEILNFTIADWDVQWSGPELLAQVTTLMDRPAVFETRHRRKDGAIRDVEINSVGVTLDGRKYVYASARDITERKLAAADREKLAAQNQQLQKTESLSRMAGAIAHHFNNQLQAVMMRLEMALNDLPRNIEPVASLNEAMISARKAAEVSTQMLTYLGQSFDYKEPLDLAAICTQCLTVLRPALGPALMLATELPSPGPRIPTSANQIHQILTNLLTNACEACADGKGTIRLSVRTVTAADIPSVNRVPLDWQPHRAEYACLEVADTGCGIAAQDIGNLFDPFYSSKFTGRGLGLSVVLGITRTHQGACTVQSEPGKGSVFRIFLPTTNAEPARHRTPGPDAR